MVTVGLWVRVEAKPDKVAEVEATLKSVVDQVRHEGKAVVWFALRLGPTTFAIYDAFADNADRQAHLDANSAALHEAGATLFTEPPVIEHVDIVASLLPGD
jgi:quinol monooxygenase YgiN